MHRSRPASRLFTLALLVTALPLAATAGPDFEALTRARDGKLIEWRRWLHAHAELSLREGETQAWMRDRLLEIPGVRLVEGNWGTGLVAVLDGGKPGPLLAYRADMDGLPLTEATGLPFACTRTDTLGGRDVGVMHACGHDLHMTMLLGVASAFSEVRADLPGRLMLVVQPAEEIGAGAASLIASGLFDGNRKPEAIFAIHDHPTLMFGQVGYCPGRSAAAVDAFQVKVLGRGGHGAYPHKTIDPVVIAAEMVLALQSIVSREVDAAEQAVLTVASIQGGSGATNVIPDFVELAGTVRTLEPAVRAQMQAALERTVKGIAAAHGAPEPEIVYTLGTPSVHNDPALVDDALPVFERVVGPGQVVRYAPALGGEDFSYYQEQIPGFIFRLGVGRPDRPMALHNASFDPDERAIPLGVRLMSEVLWERFTAARN
jgi:amidohydrolase